MNENKGLRFKPGDHVRRKIDTVSNQPAIGTIIATIANSHALSMFNEYEVDFGPGGVLVAYDHQLEPA